MWVVNKRSVENKANRKSSVNIMSATVHVCNNANDESRTCTTVAFAAHVHDKKVYRRFDHFRSLKTIYLRFKMYLFGPFIFTIVKF